MESWENNYYKADFEKRDELITSQYDRLIEKAPTLDQLLEDFNVPLRL